MPAGIKRGADLVGTYYDESGNVTTNTWRAWVIFSDGSQAWDYVDVDSTTIYGVDRATTDADAERYFKEIEEKERKQIGVVLDRLQNEGPTFSVPLPNSSTGQLHIGGGKCWCSRNHPPHKELRLNCDEAETCWCGVKHCGAGIPR